VYVSRLIREQSTPGRAVGRAWREAITLTSFAIMEELRMVLHRPKLARYIQPEKIEPYIEKIGELGLIVVNSPPSAPAAIRATTNFWKLRCMVGRM